MLLTKAAQRPRAAERKEVEPPIRSTPHNAITPADVSDSLAVGKLMDREGGFDLTVIF